MNEEITITVDEVEIGRMLCELEITIRVIPGASNSYGQTCDQWHEQDEVELVSVSVLYADCGGVGYVRGPQFATEFMRFDSLALQHVRTQMDIYEVFQNA